MNHRNHLSILVVWMVVATSSTFAASGDHWAPITDAELQPILESLHGAPEATTRIRVAYADYRYQRDALDTARTAQMRNTPIPEMYGDFENEFNQEIGNEYKLVWKRYIALAAELDEALLVEFVHSGVPQERVDEFARAVLRSRLMVSSYERIYQMPHGTTFDVVKCTTDLGIDVAADPFKEIMHRYAVDVDAILRELRPYLCRLDPNDGAELPVIEAAGTGEAAAIDGRVEEFAEKWAHQWNLYDRLRTRNSLVVEELVALLPSVDSDRLAEAAGRALRPFAYRDDSIPVQIREALSRDDLTVPQRDALQDALNRFVDARAKASRTMNALYERTISADAMRRRGREAGMMYATQKFHAPSPPPGEEEFKNAVRDWENEISKRKRDLAAILPELGGAQD